MRELHIITDLQFGSTGKGLFAGYLGKKLQPDTVVTAWGPNAGHTYVDEHGEKFVNIMLANSIQTSERLRRVLIGPGSIINPDIMLDEVKRYWPKLSGCQFYIHEHAAVVTQEHRDAEAQYGYGIGSTMKGVGEAVIEKLRRKSRLQDPTFYNVAKSALARTELADFVVSRDVYDRAVDDADVVLLEGAQGFSLGINSGFYPYCTSRECTTAQLISDCGLPMPLGRYYHRSVYGVARTYPIRVANRYAWTKGVPCDHPDADRTPGGRCLACGASYLQVGTSGPCYNDQREIDWKDIGREPELTTVTKLPRRIFTFSEQQIHDAVRMNGVNHVFLNFCNYVRDRDELLRMQRTIEKYAPVKWTGWGPSVYEIVEE